MNKLLTKIIDILNGKIKRSLKKDRSPIIIAGLGRCGTTLVYESLKKNHSYLPVGDFLMFSNKVEFENNYVYKTHDYPPKSLPSNVKVIFMFGNPMNTVISSHRRINEWGISHHDHLGSNSFRPNDDILYRDTLELNKLFDAWNQKQKFDYLSIRYETLYSSETIKAISDYLGFQFKLLPQKKRMTNWTEHPLKEDLKRVYGGLNRKIEDAPNYIRRF